MSDNEAMFEDVEAEIVAGDEGLSEEEVNAQIKIAGRIIALHLDDMVEDVEAAGIDPKVWLSTLIAMIVGGATQMVGPMGAVALFSAAVGTIPGLVADDAA